MDFDKLPIYGPKRWDFELFIVVDAGDGEIALHSPSHGRFMRMESECRWRESECIRLTC